MPSEDDPEKDDEMILIYDLFQVIQQVVAPNILDHSDFEWLSVGEYSDSDNISEIAPVEPEPEPEPEP